MSKDIFKKIEQKILKRGFNIERKDFNRPWGGFIVIEEEQASKFISLYFPEEKIQDLTKGAKVSPKILIVQADKRLSWQYHFRRSEVWKVIEGKVGVIKSLTDEQGEVEILSVGEKITLQQGERHRLVGLDEVGILAEIWQHTDPKHPSDEDDIVRLQDDFGR